MKYQTYGVKNDGYRQPYRLEFMIVKYWRIKLYGVVIIFLFPDWDMCFGNLIGS
jgi:hypothetical protein